MPDTSPPAPPIDAARFIAKWSGVTASELSTAQSFALDLCRLLGVDAPHPDAEQRYMFERPVTFVHGDGSESAGRIDLYKRGCFVLEAKKLRQNANTRGFDDAMLRARSQAEQYARALPAAEGRPPFLIVVDVSNRIELYAEFSRSGATYTPFPDPRSYRIALADLADEKIRERLRQIWTDPLALDPARASARVTREIAAKLAELAKSLERAGHRAEPVAQFLMRCLFTMFAEDVTLLPQDAFLNLLQKHADKPEVAMRMLHGLWCDMDAGGFSTAIACDVLRFNGKLFKNRDTLPLDRAQIALLIEAARAQWDAVEPAIFGTLLERALDPDERHKLGAHYTPRAYVERLVLPTIIEPLRKQWSDAQAAALTLAAEGKHDEAVAALRAFHHRLCNVRVLDPACGSGNFLYVTLEHLKRLEGEVLNALDEFGFRQTDLAISGERADASAGETVDPHNLLGIEMNPRAAAIAEVVLWIGYLQWHFRTRGNVHPPIPVVRDFRNIENRDAVLAYDGVEFVADERGVPVTRWDGKTYKASPVTGEDVPDESARVPLERYLNPRKAAWPQADFVVGNPPFIGNKRMRLALGDGYVEALRATWNDVPESADFVMYWWHHAALLARQGALQRFGFITTNSIRQTFNRRVLEAAMALAVPSPAQRGKVAEGRKGAAMETPLSLVFAIPDHPWVDTANGAAVRIAMTAAQAGDANAVLQEVTDEHDGDDGEVVVDLRERRGRMFADLKIGADVAEASTLIANQRLACPGVQLSGQGFIVEPKDVRSLSDRTRERMLRRYVTGRDVTQSMREQYVLDTYGVKLATLRSEYPDAFQWLHDRVKPERDDNPREKYRREWWIYAEPRGKFRASLAGLSRFVVTSRTARHRTFQFLDSSFLPETKVLILAFADAFILGVLSSAVHVAFANQTGGWLGVGNDSTYNHSECFDKFPFPAPTPEQQARIRDLAEQLDAHRKRQQAAHPDLTLTGMYNVLEKLRSGDALTAKERTIHEQGLVSVLRQLHDDLDAAVLDAYGWSDLLPMLHIANGSQAKPIVVLQLPPLIATREAAKIAFDEAILERLVALNAQRAAEEARGQVRWLRPDFQNPQAQAKPVQAEIDTGAQARDSVRPERSGAAAKSKDAKATAWPKDTIDQVRVVADLLAASATPQSIDDIAARFSARGPWKKRLPPLLDMLVALGRAREARGRYTGA
ncbi:MAG: class I SAM-dependent DNA methyltransferase [Proteobacteria bacterium]|nr:class I SAM-dependent DNA methyltransferase [Pseudomonadota bacterium]